jgi:hypothetical protein
MARFGVNTATSKLSDCPSYAAAPGAPVREYSRGLYGFQFGQRTVRIEP